MRICLFRLLTSSYITRVTPLYVFSFLFPGRKYDSGEHLNITSITRDQAGNYECSALNDIASPDTKTVKVTVNCKYAACLLSFTLLGSEL